jgi:hypothetical protein
MRFSSADSKSLPIVIGLPFTSIIHEFQSVGVWQRPFYPKTWNRAAWIPSVVSRVTMICALDHRSNLAIHSSSLVAIL